MEDGRNPHLQRILEQLNNLQSSTESSLASEASTRGSTHNGTAHGQYQHMATSSSTATARADPPRVISDASTITTWPAALKHVTKHIAPNENIGSRIKHLILEQHKHERQWWAGREVIVSRQLGRASKQMKAAELLKSIGGVSIAKPSASSDPEADRAELDAYDVKVYGELKRMAINLDRQLRAMGVPFFAIKHELVILEEGEVKARNGGRVDKGELRELQKKMLQTLEDLFSE